MRIYNKHNKHKGFNYIGGQLKNKFSIIYIFLIFILISCNPTIVVKPTATATKEINPTITPTEIPYYEISGIIFHIST